MYNKTIVFWAACTGMLLFGISLTTLGSVVPDLRARFALDEIAAGTLFSILPIGILIGSLFFGPVADRYGYKTLLVLSCFGMAAGFEGIAYAPSLLLLKICVFIFGMGGGVINGAVSAVVADISSERKSANLSLLGVFFGLGALGMPLVLGILKNVFSYEGIVASVGFFTLAVGLFYLFISFPPSKKAQGFSLAKGSNLFKDGLLLFIAFFLFCQSSFEGIINNWTTTYLTKHLSGEASDALFALTLYVAGMTVMRLLIGSLFRNVAPQKMQWISLGIIFIGGLLLYVARSYSVAVAGLILLGAGLGGGFPIMLGFVGNLYAERSGTAFSFVLTVALLGNMLVNYVVGLISQTYGIRHLPTVVFAELAIMLLLCLFILRSRRLKQ